MSAPRKPRRPKLVDDWRERLKKSWAIQVATFGAVAPDLLNILAERIESVPLLTPEWRATIKTVCLMAIPVLILMKQKNLQPPAPPPDDPK